MNRAPAFQFYPDKWQSHTFHLSDAAYRLYHEILCWMWQHSPDQCSITSNPSTIAILMRRQCDGTADAVREITNPAMPLLKEVGDRLVSEGLKKEKQKQSKRRTACSESAKRRWHKDFDSCERIANAMQTVCSPSPIPSPTTLSIPPTNGASRQRGGITEGGNSDRIPTSEQSKRIATIFHRRHSTAWSEKEISAYRKLGTIPNDDLTAVEAYYASERKKGDEGRHRRDLMTFLNNFQGELDRAREFTQKKPTNGTLNGLKMV